MKTRQTKLKAAQLWIVLARCHRAVSALVERSVAGLGLCLSDFMVLEALLHKGPLTISDIQAKVLLASGSMTAAVDRLEMRGLVVRKTTAADRRARLLELTSEGRQLIHRAFKEHSADLDRVMSVLGAAEKDKLYAGLKKLGQFAAEALRENVAMEKVS
jgi:MarR family transcriptional regulator, 2-MHQ and catechol-resistance regulon repressor